MQPLHSVEAKICINFIGLRVRVIKRCSRYYHFTTEDSLLPFHRTYFMNNIYTAYYHRYKHMYVLTITDILHLLINTLPQSIFYQHNIYIYNSYSTCKSSSYKCHMMMIYMCYICAIYLLYMCYICAIYVLYVCYICAIYVLYMC